MVAEALTFKFLISKNPHNESEFLQVTLSSLQASWWASKLRLCADHGVWNIVTASKFNDCPLLEIPGLNLDITAKWDGSTNHHKVFPYAPSPQLSPQHDSWAGFRSRQVELSVGLTLSTSQTKKPCVLLYANTLKWLQRLNRSLGDVHPVKRGTYYNATPPPSKPTLGAHMQTLRLNVQCPQLSLVYYNSYFRDVGVWMKGTIYADTVFSQVDSHVPNFGCHVPAPTRASASHH